MARKSLILLLALAGCGHPPSAFEKMSRLERELRLTAQRTSPGVQLSVWLSRADGRELLAIDADRPVPAASLLKVLILVEAHAQALDGRFRWTDEYTLLATDRVGGTGSFQREAVGSTWTYLQFARRMISESDNTAANVLLRRLGQASVNERAQKLGLRVTRFEREYMDFRAQREGRENWTTAREIGVLLRAIFRREILTKDACDAMIASLERTSRGRLADGVPKEVPVGHKAGVMAGGLCHDAGWVRVPGQPYIAAVLLEGVLPPGEDGEDRGLAALGALGRLIYGALGPTEE